MKADVGTHSVSREPNEKKPVSAIYEDSDSDDSFEPTQDSDEDDDTPQPDQRFVGRGKQQEITTTHHPKEAGNLSNNLNGVRTGNPANGGKRPAAADKYMHPSKPSQPTK